MENTENASEESIKCYKCPNMLKLYRGNPKVGFYITTAGGYRNHCRLPNYFCSSACLEYFKKYDMCYLCFEGSEKLVYKDKLGYSLCLARGDNNTSCAVKYDLEKRFIKNYKDTNTKYVGKITHPLKDMTLCNMPTDYDKLYSIIEKNDNNVSLDMLRDIYYAYKYYNLRIDEVPHEEPVSVENIDKCMDCGNKLCGIFYFVSNAKKDGFVCCGMTDKSHYDVYNYTYKNTNYGNNNYGMIVQLHTDVHKEEDLYSD